MNDHNPYDQSLRDKLSRLPVPDVEKNWPQMRALLDEEMPPGERSKRRGGWWFFSAILIFIIAGSWTLLTLNFSKQNVDPPLSATKQTPPPTAAANKTGPDKEISSEKPGTADDKILLNNQSVNDKKGSQDEPTSQSPLTANAVNIDSGKELVGNTNRSPEVSTGKSNVGQNKNPIAARPATIAGEHIAANPVSNGNDRPRNANDRPKNANDRLTNESDRLTNANDRLTNASDRLTNSNDRLKNADNRVKAVGDPSNASGTGMKDLRSTINPRRSQAKGTTDVAASVEVANDRQNANNRPGSKQQPAVVPRNPAVVNIDDVDNYTINEVQDQGMDPAIIPAIERIAFASFAESLDSIKEDYGSYIAYAPVSRKYYRQNKKYGKPVNIRQPYSTAGRNFAIGLSLPLAFPLGDQKAFGYNVNAGPNTASDYIPAPHAQYHFNAKAYIQSELQLMSPQYIKPAVLYQTRTWNTQYQTTSTVSAHKLYYFNVPVSLHYSPFKHFYMGTGLQFSSLLSGVAMHEEMRTGMVPSDSIYHVAYSKFSNDSISGKLNGNEMRLMLDANYYWNKFTVGLRYNQALSNYVSTRVAPTAPLTVDKNKSLQFYMRYNLWEDKKRKVTTRTLVVR